MPKIVPVLRRLKWPFIIIAFAACIVLTIIMLRNSRALPDYVWLPDTTAFPTSDDWTVDELPVSSKTVQTPHGTALLYQSQADKDSGQSWQKIYQFRSRPDLRPGSCPNVGKIESLMPSGCDKIGSFSGQPVYALHRSLPSGMTEYFMNIDGTFVSVQSGGDGGQSLKYIETFQRLPRGKSAAYFAASRAVVQQTQDRIDRRTAAEKLKNSLSYTKLDFTPAVPTAIPEGWKMHRYPEGTGYQLDGPDADHPAMVNYGYTNNRDNLQGVDMHSVRRSGITLGSTCGPTPGNNMEKLPCTLTPSGYYEALVIQPGSYTARYLYYPLGDTVLISGISRIFEEGQPHTLPTAIMAIQDALMRSAKPTNKDSFKGSEYYKVYY